MRLKKIFLFLAVFAGLMHEGFAFSPLGPFKDWQTAALGYRYNAQIGGPMQPFEAYRWNVPVITYAFDSTFIRYFGTNGIYEVEKAIKLLQDLPPMDQIQVITNNNPFGPPTFDFVVTTPEGSTDIVPKQPYGFNQTAADLGLFDLKSQALALIVEELGLTTPVFNTWGLRGRTVGPGALTNYGIIIQNYDPVTLRPSTNVNDINWGYQIFDPAIPGVADAVENALSPDFLLNYPVAENLPFSGYFYERLSYDDVGGFRYIYNTNTTVVETLLNTGSTVVQRGSGAGIGSSPWTIVLGPTNVGTNGFSFTNLVNPSNVVDQVLRPGINKLNFFRVEYDSLIGQTFRAVTNFYTDTYISNATVLHQPLQRIIRQPDILFTAEDLGLLPASVFPVFTARTGTAGWVNNSALNSHGGANVYGPGIITPPVVIRFTDLLPFYFNSNPAFLGGDLPTEASQTFEGSWGSYDASTNAVVIYPDYMGITIDTIRTVLTNKATVIRF